MSSPILSQPAPPLPSTLRLFLDAVRLYRTEWNTFIGYAGWLLVPLTLHILVRVTFGDEGGASTALMVLSGVYVAIAVWSFVHIVTHTAHIVLHHAPPENIPDVRPVLLGTFLASLLYVLVVTVGAVLIVPGVLFATWFAFAPFAVALHTHGVFTAFAESRDIVRGRFFAVLVRMWSIDVLFMCTYLALILAIDFALGYDAAHLDPTAPLPVPIDIVLSVFEIITVPLLLVYRTVLYLALKNR